MRRFYFDKWDELNKWVVNECRIRYKIDDRIGKELCEDIIDKMTEFDKREWEVEGVQREHDRELKRIEREKWKQEMSKL